MSTFFERLCGRADNPIKEKTLKKNTRKRSMQKASRKRNR